MNIQNAAFIVLAAVLGIVVQRFLGWTIPQVFLALAIANVAGGDLDLHASCPNS